MADTMLERVAYELGRAVRRAQDAMSSAVPSRVPAGRPRVSGSRGRRTARRFGTGLDDPDPAARIRALEAVRSLPDAAAVRLLTNALHDPELEVRCAAAATAGRIRADGAVFALLLALDQPDQAVREASARALAQITGEKIDLDAPDDVRREAIARLKERWKERRFQQLSGGRDPEASA